MKHLITTHTRAFLLMALMLLLPSALWAEKQAYAEYADGTLTFHYDENRASHLITYGLPASDDDEAGWWAYYKEITKVVFDESFKDARPVNLGRWFMKESNLSEITGLEYLNTSEATDMHQMFSECSSLKTLDLSHFNTENVTTMANMFYGCENLTSLNVTSFNTKNVTTMYQMFYICSNLTELNLVTFDTQNVTNMAGMFGYDANLTSVNVSSRFVTDQVEQSTNMFINCSKLPGYTSDATPDKTNASQYLTLLTPQPWVEYQADTKTLTFHYDEYQSISQAKTYSLPESGKDPRWLENKYDITKVVFSEEFKDVRPERCTKWFYQMISLTDITGLQYLNTSEVNDMSRMFYECGSLSSIDLSHFNTENVTTMTYMFYNCTSLTALDVTSFNTQKVNDMSFMFCNCKYLTSLDLSSFDTQKVTDMQRMFYFDNTLTHIYATDLFVTDQVTNSTDMFYNCQKLPGFDSNYTDKTKAPQYLTYLAPQPWVEYQADTQTLTFRYDNTQSAATATGKYDLPAAGVNPGWLEHSGDITKVVFSEDFKDARPKRCTKWFGDMSKITDIQGMQYLCTDSVVDMSGMFYECSSLKTINLIHFNTAGVTTMADMFYDCKSLTTLDLSTFNTEKVTDMSNMFWYCETIQSLNLSTFDTKNVVNMSGMFGNGSGLWYIYVSKSFVYDQVTSSDNMFLNCQQLRSFDSKYTDKTKASTYLTYLSDEVWVEFNIETGVLTFSYDNRKDIETGVTTQKYDLPTSDEEPAWLVHDEDVKKVVFNESFKTVAPTSCKKWFSKMTSLTEITGLEYLNTSSVTDMTQMFYHCDALKALDLTHFNTANVTTMGSMFMHCKSLTTLDLSSFDTRKVTYTRSMFCNCENLSRIYVSENFATNQVTDGLQMFYLCTKLPYYKDNAQSGAEHSHYNESEGGYLTLRRKISVGDKQYNVDGYVSPTCYDNVTFTDGAAYSAPCAFIFSTDKTASYTRTVSNHWATLCLPFAFSADNNSTASFYSVGSYTDGNIAVNQLTGDIAAGTPVLAYVSGSELSVSATGVSAVAAPDTLNVLQGAFTQTEVGDDEYIIANDHFWNAAWLKQNNSAVNNVYVAPYRASLSLSSTEAKPNSIRISDDAVTGIDNIDGAASIENLLDGAEFYDLQGRHLSAPQRGMIIVRKGGVSRKVMVR